MATKAKKTTRTTPTARALARMKTITKRFNAASYPLKRVMIAKDALHLMATNEAFKRKVGRGGYVTIDAEPLGDVSTKEGTQLGLYNKEAIANCTVCALGACFVSAVRLGDDFSLAQNSDNDEYNGSTKYWLGELDPFWALLRKYFSMSQMGMIECAFEDGSARYDNELTDQQTADAAHFTDGIKGGRSADLKAILENIVANRGTFKPPRWVDPDEEPARLTPEEEELGY